jgi:hypothetical protein
VTEAFDLTSATAATRFLTKCKNLPRPNLTTAFINTSQLIQTPQDIAKAGLVFDTTAGLRITLGSFAVDHSADQIEAIQVTVALGNPLNFQPHALAKLGDVEYSADAPTRAALLPGYQSLCISGSSEYVIFNRDQIDCTALVRFAGGANLAESTEADNLCDACGAAEATVWCVNCSAKLCAACDAATHAANPVLARHRRVPLVEARSIMEFCPAHPKFKLEFYCEDCKVPLCAQCKMTGSHSKGPNATHTLIPITEAYNRALAETADAPPGFAERRKAITQKLSECDVMISEVLDNAAETEKQIRVAVEDAIAQERGVAGEKALVVRSVQTELHRKLAEMESLQRSFDDHRRKSGSQAFLRAVNQQTRILAGLKDLADLPLELTVQGDVVVYGPPSPGTTFVKTSLKRERAPDDVEEEVRQVNAWIRSVIPGFGDLRTEFADGVTLIKLLQAFRPDAKPSLPYPEKPETAAERREARVAAVQFAKELGAKGTYDESVLGVRLPNPIQLIALLTSIQHEIAAVVREPRSGLSPRRAVRARARERLPPKQPVVAEAEQPVVAEPAPPAAEVSG